MATTPCYESATKRNGSYILSSSDGTTLTAAVLTGSATGTRVKEIRVTTGPGTAPGSGLWLYVVRDDGVLQVIVSAVQVQNVANYTLALLRYDAVNLVDASQSIKFQMSGSLASGATIHVDVEGADY